MLIHLELLFARKEQLGLSSAGHCGSGAAQVLLEVSKRENVFHFKGFPRISWCHRRHRVQNVCVSPEASFSGELDDASMKSFIDLPESFLDVLKDFK